MFATKQTNFPLSLLSNKILNNKQKFKKLKNPLLLLMTFTLLLLTTKKINCDQLLFPVIKTSVSSADAGSEITFFWEQVDKSDIDPKIIFWETSSYPSESNHTLYENSGWSFLNPQSKYAKRSAAASGRLKITAPSAKNLYKIYYCAYNFDGFFCAYQRPFAVISCLNNNAETKSFKKPSSNVEHLIVFISENHSFDSIYGNYCKAKTFSNPECNFGPECCEAIPAQQNGFKPKVLDDIQNARFDPCHSRECEELEINGGKMDKYLIGGIGSNPNNFAAAVDDEFSAKHYFNWARNNAMSDRFFQSSAGASSQNDMYFAGGKFFFLDNAYGPQRKDLIPGSQCREDFISYYDPTVLDLLNTCNVSWKHYGQGQTEKFKIEDCSEKYFDATDNPFAYFPSLTDGNGLKEKFVEFEQLVKDIQNGDLPSVSYVKTLEMYTEHPGNPGGFVMGQMHSNKIVEAVKNSEKYRNNTLVFLVPDESGGFYDHMTPPPTSAVDGMNYGPRTQFIVVGEIAKKNYISHVQLEPSSIIRFIEWNWIGEEGQLHTRDRVVNNIGDMLDAEKAGVEVPSFNESNEFNKKKDYFASDKVEEKEHFVGLKFLDKNDS